jgi:hypothetical protein
MDLEEKEGPMPDGLTERIKQYKPLVDEERLFVENNCLFPFSSINPQIV